MMHKDVIYVKNSQLRQIFTIITNLWIWIYKDKTWVQYFRC